MSTTGVKLPIFGYQATDQGFEYWESWHSTGDLEDYWDCEMDRSREESIRLVGADGAPLQLRGIDEWDYAPVVVPGAEPDPSQLERVLREYLRRQYAEHSDLFDLSDDKLASAGLPELVYMMDSLDGPEQRIWERHLDQSRIVRLLRRVGWGFLVNQHRHRLRHGGDD
jgi:hypothetical protein